MKFNMLVLAAECFFICAGFGQEQLGNPLWYEMRLQEPWVRKILFAPTIDSLEMIEKSMPFHDPAVGLLYAYKSLMLMPSSRNELKLCARFPQSPPEFYYLCTIADFPFKDTLLCKTAATIFYKLPKLFAEIVLTHREQIQAFFRFGASMRDGATSETFGPDASWLCEQDCVWYFHELGKAKQEIADEVLADMRTGPPSRKCVDDHRDQIDKRYVEYLFEDD
jgi:hypothetical protein